MVPSSVAPGIFVHVPMPEEVLRFCVQNGEQERGQRLRVRLLDFGLDLTGLSKSCVTPSHRSLTWRLLRTSIPHEWFPLPSSEKSSVVLVGTSTNAVQATSMASPTGGFIEDPLPPVFGVSVFYQISLLHPPNQVQPG